jgi:hypothetical protein
VINALADKFKVRSSVIEAIVPISLSYTSVITSPKLSSLENRVPVPVTIALIVEVVIVPVLVVDQVALSDQLPVCLLVAVC